MSSLFCIGKYHSNDKARLAYSSMHKSGSVFAEFIESLFKDLKLDIFIPRMLNIKLHHYSKIPLEYKKEYVGSSMALKQEKAIEFFDNMKQLIFIENNEIDRFSLISIYVRYALSLLLGTRSFNHSSSLQKISFTMGILNISEKSNTLLSGIRIIPLCERAKDIIIYYQQQCKEMNILSDNIYFKYDGIILNTKYSLLKYKTHSFTYFIYIFTSFIKLSLHIF